VNNMTDSKKPSAIRRITKKAATLPVIGKLCEPKNRVAVLRMSGIIADQDNRKGGVSWARYMPLIEKTFDISDLDEVCLVINSPGGAPAQCSLISSAIGALSNEKNIPVTAFVEDIAASGGYWLACVADKIYAQPSSIVGSIGVIAATFGFDRLIKKHDIERRIYAAGEQKSFLDPFQPENEKDVKRLKTMQKSIHKNFIEWVKERRGEKLKGTDKNLFEGQVWVGQDAVDHGLIDDIGDVFTVMKNKYGNHVKFIAIEPEKSFVQSLITGQLLSRMRINTDDVVSTLENRLEWQKWGL